MATKRRLSMSGRTMPTEAATAPTEVSNAEIQVRAHEHLLQAHTSCVTNMENTTSANKVLITPWGHAEQLVWSYEYNLLTETNEFEEAIKSVFKDAWIRTTTSGGKQQE
eukprot:8463872-Karenia_brevis.AAC.1